MGKQEDSSKLVVRWMHLFISSRAYSTPLDRMVTIGAEPS